MSTFLGIVSITPFATISTTSITTGKSATTALITASVTGQNLGGSYTYLWKQTGTACTINTPNAASTTIIGGGIAGFSDIFCEITYSTTKITTKTPTCQITWTNTGIPITSVTWNILVSGNSSYTGLAQSVSVVSVMPSGATYTTSTTTATNATEQASTTIVGTGSYSGVFTSPVLTIIPQTISLFSSGSTSFIYVGTSQSVGYVVSGVVIQDTNWSVTGISGTNAANYTAQLLTTSPNYTLSSGASSFAWDIQPAVISISVSGPSIFTYSGLSQSVGYNVTGVVPQDTNWSVSGVTGTNVGSYSASLSETSPNYTLGTSSFPWLINPLTISIASTGSTSFTYSGQLQSVGYNVIGVVPQDTDWSVAGVTGTNAATYSAILSETSPNYTLGTNSFTWTIGTSTITIAASGSTSLTYSGVSQSVGYNVTGIFPEDTNWSVTGASGTNAASYTATLAETSNNYTLGVPSTLAWTIGTRTISIASSGATSFAWNGSAQSVGYTISGNVPEDTNWSVTGVSGTNANNYTATLSETSSNYTLGTSTFLWNITPTAPANFSVTSVDSYSIANFSWDAIGGCTYELWVAVEPFYVFSLDQSNITGTTASYAGATDFNYQFYVKAVAPSGTSPQSRTAFVYMGRASYNDTIGYDSGWLSANSTARRTFVTPGCLSGTASGEVGLRTWTQGSNIAADSANSVIITSVSVRNCVCQFSTSLLWGTATRNLDWNLNGSLVNFPLSTSTSAPNPYTATSTRSVTQTSGTISYTLRASGTGWSTNNTGGVSGTFYFVCEWRNQGTQVVTIPANPPTWSYS